MRVVERAKWVSVHTARRMDKDNMTVAFSGSMKLKREETSDSAIPSDPENEFDHIAARNDPVG